MKFSPRSKRSPHSEGFITTKTPYDTQFPSIYIHKFIQVTSCGGKIADHDPLIKHPHEISHENSHVVTCEISHEIPPGLYWTSTRVKLPHMWNKTTCERISHVWNFISHRIICISTCEIQFHMHSHMWNFISHVWNCISHGITCIFTCEIVFHMQFTWLHTCEFMWVFYKGIRGQINIFSKKI